jgi:hypothetical protein
LNLGGGKWEIWNADGGGVKMREYGVQAWAKNVLFGGDGISEGINLRIRPIFPNFIWYCECMIFRWSSRYFWTICEFNETLFCHVLLGALSGDLDILVWTRESRFVQGRVFCKNRQSSPIYQDSKVSRDWNMMIWLFTPVVWHFLSSAVKILVLDEWLIVDRLWNRSIDQEWEISVEEQDPN